MAVMHNMELPANLPRCAHFHAIVQLGLNKRKYFGGKQFGREPGQH